MLVYRYALISPNSKCDTCIIYNQIMVYQTVHFNDSVGLFSTELSPQCLHALCIVINDPDQ